VPSLALLLDPSQPVGFVLVGIVSGRLRYQLRALFAEMIETTPELAARQRVLVPPLAGRMPDVGA
jgi:hypothetical protein